MSEMVCASNDSYKCVKLDNAVVLHTELMCLAHLRFFGCAFQRRSPELNKEMQKVKLNLISDSISKCNKSSRMSWRTTSDGWSGQKYNVSLLTVFGVQL